MNMCKTEITFDKPKFVKRLTETVYTYQKIIIVRLEKLPDLKPETDKLNPTTYAVSMNLKEEMYFLQAGDKVAPCTEKEANGTLKLFWSMLEKEMA